MRLNGQQDKDGEAYIGAVEAIEGSDVSRREISKIVAPYAGR
jgi:hypothetical protein